MAYDGYLRLNGIEIANAARTTRYVNNLLPTFGLKGCQDCEGLEAALGETYNSPLADSAPWYDPSMPSSGSFYGFFPTSIEGIDDSTREAVTTELVGDGSITNRPRFAGRDIRVNGVLIGATEQAVETGMMWLNRALSGPCTGEIGCQGSDLNFYSSCPSVQDWSDAPQYIASMAPSGAAAEVDLWYPSDPSGTVTDTGSGLEFDGPDGTTFSRLLQGFIPGATYRLRMRTDSTPYTVSISGAKSFTFDHHNLWAAQPVYTVLDFTPTTQNALLSITPDSGLSLEIVEYSIFRTHSDQTVLQTEYDQPGDISGGWTHAALPAGLIGAWRQGATFAITSTGGSVSYPINSGPTKSIDYPSSGRVRVTLEGTFTGPGNTQPVSLSTSFNNHDIIQEFHRQDGDAASFYYMFEYDVTPGIGGNLITLDSGQAVNVTTTNSATWEIGYLMVEQVDETLVPEDPNPGLEFERLLRNVVTISGPTTVERLAPDCGAMRRVSFGLRAGVPFHYGSPKHVGNVLGSESGAMPEVECLEDDAAAVNYVTNPRFVAGTSWSQTGFSSLTPGVNGFYPNNRLLTGAGAAGLTASITGDFTVPAAYMPLPGAPYVVGVFVETTNVTDVTLSLLFNTTDPLGTGGSTTVTVPAATSPVPTLTPIVAFGYAPPNTVNMRLRVDFEVSAGSVGTASISAPIITFGLDLPSYEGEWTDALPTPADYFDGESTNADWYGTTDNSISLYTPAEDPVVYDPACPVIPTPPAPPTIDNACVLLPSDWTRYTIPIPESFIPTTATADPIITFSTTVDSVNNVRIRFYPADLGPFAACGFDGEILLSYMPSHSTVVIDATRKTATLIRDGHEDQSIAHLLYGPDLGPVQWPDLSCGISYIFAADVAAYPGLILTGVAPGRASTPDTAALDITGDIDLRVHVAMDDWAPAAEQALVGKYDTTTNQRSYVMRLGPSGNLQLLWSTAGTSAETALSTAAITAVDGQALWVRATLDVNNGAAGRDIKFYTSEDGITWTQLGATVTQATATSIFSGTAELAVGAINSGGNNLLAGRVIYAEVRNGIAGTIVANPNFGAQSEGTTSFVDGTGLTWTITSPATIDDGRSATDTFQVLLDMAVRY